MGKVFQRLPALRSVIRGLILVLLLQAGCTPPLPAPTPTLPPPVATSTPVTLAATSTPISLVGWTLYKKLDEGYAIALPPTWKQVDLDREKVDSLLKSLKDQNPRMRTEIESQAEKLITSGIKFYGFELPSESESTPFITNINIGKQPVSDEMTLSFYVRFAARQLENNPSVLQPIVHRRMNLMAGEGEEMRWRIQVNDAQGQPVTLALMQYVVIKNNLAYVVTLGTTEGQIQEYAPLFEKIGESFRFLE